MEKRNSEFKLSEDQVNLLFEFTRKKLVHWYDLQIEIVDHLASSIEAEIGSGSASTFEAALEKVYKGFGIFGFAKIVQERQKLLYKSAKQMWWNELWSIFHWPRVTLFLLIISMVWTVSILVDSSLLAGLFFTVYITLSVMMFIYIVKDNRVQKRLLLMQSGSTYYTSPFIYEFVVISTCIQRSPLSFTILLSLGILVKLASFHLYRKIRNEAKRLYPAVFLS